MWPFLGGSFVKVGRDCCMQLETEMCTKHHIHVQSVKGMAAALGWLEAERIQNCIPPNRDFFATRGMMTGVVRRKDAMW